MLDGFDILALTDAGLPPEWANSALDEQALALLDADDPLTKQARLACGLMPEWESKLRDRRAAQRFYLLRNIWGFKAPTTGRTEAYFTYAGVERPFHGLDAVFGMLMDVLEDSLAAGNLIAEALLLGALEPITERQARLRYLAIFGKSKEDLRPAHLRGGPWL